MEHGFQYRLQISLDHRLGDAIGYRRDGQRKLHLNPVSLWDGLRSVIPSIRFVVNASLCSRGDA